MSQELPIHVSEVPTYEPRGDCIRVTWRSLELFVPVPIAKAAVGRLNRALDEWHEGKGTVVRMRPPRIATK